LIDVGGGGAVVQSSGAVVDGQLFFLDLRVANRYQSR
jgi:hypothetical protein